MSSTSNLSFKQLAIPHFGDVFALIDDVLQRQQVPYYLIGANALSLQLLRQGEPPIRATKDIDFAVMVSSFDQYDAVRDELLATGFHEAQLPYTLRHVEYNVVIDLLPFGKIEEKDKVRFHERQVDLVVLGFKEILSEAETIMLESQEISVPPLPGIVLLKLISWSDRPEMRSSDLDDIYHIITVYHDLSFDEITEQHSELLLSEPYDTKLIAARLLGRKMAPILQKSATLLDRISQVLREQQNTSRQSGIAMRWAQNYQLSLKDAGQLLGEMRKGIEDSAQ